MKRFNLPLAADTFFAGGCAFLLFFTAVRYYTQNALLGLGFGIAAALLFGALAYFYISRKQNKKFILSRDEKEKNLLALHLSLSPENEVKKLFLRALGEGAKPSGKKIVLGGVACFFIFKMSPLNEDDIARVIKYRFEGEKRVYCVALSAGAEALADKFCIKAAKIDEIYDLLKGQNLLPEKYIYNEPPKTSFIKLIKSRFGKKIRAPLFWSGAGLIALSYFTFFPIYYIVSGSIMLVLSALSLAFNQS